MKLVIGNIEYWIKDDVPSNFYSMSDDEKLVYIWNNNLLHREDGPTIIYSDGTQAWYLNDLCYRIDGPAIIRPDGSEDWYLNGIEIDGEIYKKIQNSSKEELLVYMIDSEYKDYLPLIEYGLSL